MKKLVTDQGGDPGVVFFVLGCFPNAMGGEIERDLIWALQNVLDNTFSLETTLIKIKETPKNNSMNTMKTPEHQKQSMKTMKKW